MIPIYEIAIPDYRLELALNFSVIGAKLDELLKQQFPDRWIAVRGISLHDHPGRSADELVELIREHGTDRYDPQRKGVHHSMDSEFGIDLHAIPMFAHDGMIECPHYSGERLSTGSPMGEALLDLYEGAKVDRGYPLRIDLILIYDLEQLQAAPMVWTEAGPQRSTHVIATQSSTVFCFKNPEEKSKALLGVIKIL